MSSADMVNRGDCAAEKNNSPKPLHSDCTVAAHFVTLQNQLPGPEGQVAISTQI